VAFLGAAAADDPRWQNLLTSMQWINDNPLPSDASPDSVATRQLVIAALAKAENTMQGNNAAAASADYAAAASAYNQFAIQQGAKEMPSGFSLWLAGLGLDIANPLAKIGLYAGIALTAYLLITMGVLRNVASRRLH
jgi:hypothetical protein